MSASIVSRKSMERLIHCIVCVCVRACMRESHEKDVCYTVRQSSSSGFSMITRLHAEGLSLHWCGHCQPVLLSCLSVAVESGNNNLIFLHQQEVNLKRNNYQGQFWPLVSCQASFPYQFHFSTHILQLGRNHDVKLEPQEQGNSYRCMAKL